MASAARHDLARLTREIHLCLASWPVEYDEAARRLKEVFARRLWRRQYRTASDFCEQEFGFQERFGWLMIHSLDAERWADENPNCANWRPRIWDGPEPTVE